VILKAHEFDRIVTKYGFTIRDTGDRPAYLEYEGRIVVRTKRSHVKGKDLPFSHKIRQQLCLTEQQMGAAIVCTFTRDHYLAHLRQRGVIPR
jgi:hypothetical protein